MTLSNQVRRALRVAGRQAAVLLAAALWVAAPHALAQAGAMPKAAGRAGPPMQMVLEPRALDLLKASSARLAAARTLAFTAVVNEEYPSRLGPTLAYAVRYDVTMQRPDKLRVLTSGAGPGSEFYIDGKVMLAYAPGPDLVAVADAPPTLDAALQKAFDQAAIFYPFTDLLLADPYAVVARSAKLAFYIGPSGAVGGTNTEMVAWANDEVFLQMWIGAEDKLPRRVRAIYRNDPSQFRHEMELSNWQLDAAIAEGTFTSLKAQNGKSIKFAPPAAPPPRSRSAPVAAPKTKSE